MELVMTAVKMISLLGVLGLTPSIAVSVYRGIEVKSNQVWVTSFAWMIFIWSMGWLN